MKQELAALKRKLEIARTCERWKLRKKIEQLSRELR